MVVLPSSVIRSLVGPTPEQLHSLWSSIIAVKRNSRTTESRRPRELIEESGGSAGIADPISCEGGNYTTSVVEAIAYVVSVSSVTSYYVTSR